jgi:mono/diheme cytochrome c family protein
VKTLSIALALLLAVLLGALIAGAALLFRGGITARVAPTHLESVIARRLLRLGIPDASRRLRNPEASSKELVAAGRAHFADHCAICHGNDGGGQSEMGRNLYPRVPDLRLSDTQQLTDGEIFYIVENGIRFTGMPGWGDGGEESSRASWHLVAFIRHLPHLTPAEKLEMDRLSPKTPDEWREMQEDEAFLKGSAPSPDTGRQHR